MAFGKVTEFKIYSQNGEDGIISSIFNIIETTNRYFVELGINVSDGKIQGNTIYLREQGWDGLWIDHNVIEGYPIHNHFITAENVNEILKEYDVPNDFDLLSIDLDFNDYWIWKAIEYNPRVVVIEYNATIPVNEIKAVKYEKNRTWDGTNYFGASLKALAILGRQKGYKLIYCDQNGVNAFFVRDEYASLFPDKSYRSLYRRPAYGGQRDKHKITKENMIEPQLNKL